MKMLTLRDYRRAHELSQPDLAALSGVSQCTISRIEAGRRPRLENALRLAKVYGLTLEEFCELVEATRLEAERRAKEEGS